MDTEQANELRKLAVASSGLLGAVVRIRNGNSRTANILGEYVAHPTTGQQLEGWVIVDRDLKHPRRNKWYRHWPITKLEIVKAPNNALSKSHEIEPQKKLSLTA